MGSLSSFKALGLDCLVLPSKQRDGNDQGGCKERGHGKEKKLTRTGFLAKAGCNVAFEFTQG